MVSYLPEFPTLMKTWRRGRSVYEGYQRGWGLQFGELQLKVQADPDYQYALTFASGRSVMLLERMMNLFLLIKFFLPVLPFGHIIEFGSFRGGSAFFMAALAERFLPGVQVFALDTFAGMPLTDKSIDGHSVGDFANTDLTEILDAKKQYGLANVNFVKGLFSDTAPGVLLEAERIALAHIDCDIYNAVKYSYEVTKPHMVSGGYVVFDDSLVSSCVGATEAVEELVVARDGLFSEQIFPHHVFRAPKNTDNDSAS